eukprot:scaffold5.g688.t1
MDALLAAPAAAPASAAGEGAFTIDSPAFASDEFRMYTFKIQRCPRARPHDWTQCPFAHSGEKAKRRDPRKYSGTACPDFRKTGACRRSDACPFSHGVFECWLHPTRYKTQLCTDGAACRRRVCFFAHHEGELRRPEEYPPLPPFQLAPDLSAELALQQQQQQQLALVSSLLAGGGPGGAAAPPAAADPLGSLHLLKGLSLAGQGPPVDSSAPGTPLGSAVPSAAAFPGGLGAQAALIKQLSGGAGAAGAPGGAGLQSQRSSDVSVLSIRSTGSPNEAADASPRAPQPQPELPPGRAGTPPADAPLLLAQAAAQEGVAAALLRSVMQQQAAVAQQAAALGLPGLEGGGAGLDPALLVALQSLSLGAAASGSMGQLLEHSPLLQPASQRLDAALLLHQQQQVQQQAAAAAAAAAEAAQGEIHRRSIDNGTLTRQLSDALQQQAAAAALLGQSLSGSASSLPSSSGAYLAAQYGGLPAGGGGGGGASASLPPLHPTSLGGGSGALSRASTPPQPAPAAGATGAALTDSQLSLRDQTPLQQPEQAVAAHVREGSARRPGHTLNRSMSFDQ